MFGLQPKTLMFQLLINHKKKLNMINRKTLATISSWITLTIFLGGCTSLKTNLSNESGPIIKIKQFDNIRIKYVNVKQLDDSLVITGQVHNLSRRLRKIEGHIDYAILSTDGSIIDEGRGLREIILGKRGRREIHDAHFQIKIPYDYTGNGQVNIGFHVNERKANIPVKCENGIFGQERLDSE